MSHCVSYSNEPNWVRAAVVGGDRGGGVICICIYLQILNEAKVQSYIQTLFKAIKGFFHWKNVWIGNLDEQRGVWSMPGAE